MFKAEEPRRKCPYTRGSQGVMEMEPGLIGMIAGTVRDTIEWMVVLKGTRSEDGHKVVVEKFHVPAQYRTAGSVDTVGEVDLTTDVVGVLHSHHRMGAFFSNTDDTQLNPRFPSSIVVAIAANNLGFNYKAEGKVTLPCGGVGIIPFVLTVRGMERFSGEVVRAHDDGDLGDCNKFEAVDAEFTSEFRADCGLAEIAERAQLFGQGDGSLLEAVRRATAKRPATYYQSSKGGSQYPALGKLAATRSGIKLLKGKKGGKGSKGGCHGCGEKGRVLRWCQDTGEYLCDTCYANPTVERVGALSERSLVYTTVPCQKCGGTTELEGSDTAWCSECWLATPIGEGKGYTPSFASEHSTSLVSLRGGGSYGVSADDLVECAKCSMWEVPADLTTMTSGEEWCEMCVGRYARVVV